jgi:hypothetical protein
MAFQIYPDATTATLLGKPANAPIALAPNEVMSAFVPLQGYHAPDPDEFNLDTTFIRIAASGPALALPHGIS